MAATTDAVLAFLAAAAIAWLLVPLAERLAFRVGAIDQPKERGLHDRPMPRLSGLAILVAVEVAGWIWLPGEAETRSILVGAVAIAAIGVIDDVRELPALLKLLGQVVAASIPVAAGVRVDNLTLPFIGGFELGWLAYPLTVLGIVAVVNVINFLDGVDGLAAGVCAIAAVTLAAIALSLERNAAGVLAALTAGAALGFLRHGFPPASSFMGDTGSNLLGYLLATASIYGALKTNAVIALAFPLIVLAVPILDTGFVVAKRLKYRQPIYQADSWHFHHRMANIGFSQRRTVAYLYGWTLVMAGLALALRFVPYSDDHGHFDALWTAVVVACLLIALASSIYLIYVLEILKLRRGRLNPETGEFEALEIDPRGSGKAHEVALQRRFAGLLGIVAHPPAPPESGAFMSPLKYVDLLVLTAALAVFLLGGFPMLGYAVGAAVWLAQRVVQIVAAKRAQAELAAGQRQRAMGIVAATTLGRVWLMATAVLLVGLSERQAGLAAAVLVLVLFTVSFAAQGLAHLFSGEPEGQGAA